MEAVEATIRDRNLRFTKVSDFDDKFEGSIPLKQIDDQAAVFTGGAATRRMISQVSKHYDDMSPVPSPEEDPWQRMTRYRRAMTRSAHACCWSAGDESEALWRLYCKDPGDPGLGVALRTTLGRLEESVEPYDLYVSPVRYRPYHEGDPFTDRIDTFMHKRRGFSAEREVRLLNFDETQYLALIQIPSGAPELPRHLQFDWDVCGTIDAIVVSPYADEAYEADVRSKIATADPGLTVPIILSELNPRQYAPGF